jgi:putative DNA primase/helicase
MVEPIRLPVVGPIIIRAASDFVVEPIHWLWRHWLASRKLHLIAGAPGTGKTTIALSLAATVSTGGTWPDGTTAPQGDVLIWSGEDSADDTLIPRLIAAGADLDRVKMISATRDAGGVRPFDPALDMEALGATIGGMPAVKLLIIDPVSSAVLGDSHKASEVRAGLQPLVDLAEKVRFAALGVHHFAKNSSGRHPADRVIGSVAFSAAPRLIMVVAQPDDPDQALRLTRAKSNIGPTGGGFEYRLLQQFAIAGNDRVEAQSIEWGAELTGTARDLLKVEEPDAEADRRSEAVEFLADLLASGPQRVADIRKAAEANGHAWRTLERAKRELGVKAAKSDMRTGWTWELPPTTSAPDYL